MTLLELLLISKVAVARMFSRLEFTFDVVDGLAEAEPAVAGSDSAPRLRFFFTQASSSHYRRVSSSNDVLVLLP